MAVASAIIRDVWSNGESELDRGSVEIDGTVRLLERLGQALHRYGTPAHRLEEALERVSRRLGAPGQFFVTPTAILASFENGGGPRQVFMVRAAPGDMDLGRLTQLETVIEGVLRGRLDTHGAEALLDDVLSQRRQAESLVTVVSFALVAAGAARFFGGGWPEIATALCIGLSSGLLAVFIGRRPQAASVFEPLAATVAAIIAMTAASLTGVVAPKIAMLGGLIVLVPGLTLTIAMNELATRNLVAGTARLVGAFMTFLTIAFGVALGTRVVGMILPAPDAVLTTPLPGWTMVVALIVAPASMAGLLRAESRDVIWIMLAGVLAFGGARFGTAMLGSELGAFAGALVVGMASNVYARCLNRPASVTLVPGILLLVPGSIGFRSLTSLLDRDVVDGLQLAFAMVLVAVAIVTGLLVANLIVQPRRVL